MTLTVHNLTCVRGGVPILAGVSFELPAGRALILRGPNGAGKTTLLRTLAGLQPAAAGRIVLDSNDCGYASHADGVKATLTVAENLAFWAHIYGRSLDESVLVAFDLAALKDRMAGSLSAGQKRRVGLARLAVIGRRVLLLDEPTVSLDSASVATFLDWLGKHLVAGGNAVIATHVDLGIDSDVLDLALFQAGPETRGGSDEAFL